MEPRERGPACTDAGGAAALPSRPCPRFATRDEWEAWHAALTWEEQLRRGDLEPPEPEYSGATHEGPLSAEETSCQRSDANAAS
jgi:hypothetical protein